MHCRELRISEQIAGQRVDAYLAARFTGWSRAAIARHIRAGQVVRAGRPVKPASILHTGDLLEIYIPGIAPTTAPPPLPPIVYEDDRVLVVDKPAGMLVHPAGDRFAWGLIGLVKRARPQHRIDLVHRLDRETSGLVVLTKDLEANAFLKKAFADRHVTKIYQAIARGVIPWDGQDVVAPIGEALSSEIKLRRGVNPAGLSARTRVEVLHRMAAHTLVTCRIFTGRTHQIRVHMEHIGHPLLGDKIYGQPDAVFLRHLDGPLDEADRGLLAFPRHALHAWSLTVPLPSGQTRTIRAPLPADMQAIVDGTPPQWFDLEGAEEGEDAADGD